MSLEEIKIAIEELANKIAKSSITPGIVANILEEIRLKVKDSIEKIDAMVGVIKSISILPSASSLKMILSKSDNSQQNVTIPAATKSTAGVMTSLDKTNLDYLTEHGATVRFDNAMSSSSENGVQNKVIKEYVDGMFDKTNILNVRMYDEVDPHFDNYSIVNIIDGTDIVATILMNTHSSGTKGIIFQNGSGWRIVTEELGDIIGAGWSQVLDDMVANSTPIGEGGGGDFNEENKRLIAGFSPRIVYENTEGNYIMVNGYLNGYQSTRPIQKEIKKFLLGGFGLYGSFSYIFDSCTELEEIYPITLCNGIQENGAQATISQSFLNCAKLKDISTCKYWDVSKVKEAVSFLRGCSNLKSVECIYDWNVSNLEKMGQMFCGSGITELLLSNWKNEVVKEVNYMFDQCSNLTKIDMRGINTKNVTNFTYMFGRCPNLEWIYAPMLDMSSCTTTTGMFTNSNKLKTLIGDISYQEVVGNNICIFNGWKGTLYTGFGYCPFNQATLRAIINGIADLTGQSTGKLDFGKDNIAKLSADDIAIATGKNWNII